MRLAAPGATFLLNCPYGADEVWDHLPRSVQQQIIDKQPASLRHRCLAGRRDAGLGGRINTVLQTCFFAISGVLPREEAMQRIKASIRKTYGAKGERCRAPELRRRRRTPWPSCSEVTVPKAATSAFRAAADRVAAAPDFVQRVHRRDHGRARATICRSALMPVDGTFPSGTAAWEKRNIADEVPVWETDLCIQCGQCALRLPAFSVIRAQFYDE